MTLLYVTSTCEPLYRHLGIFRIPSFVHQVGYDKFTSSSSLSSSHDFVN